MRTLHTLTWRTLYALFTHFQRTLYAHFDLARTLYALFTHLVRTLRTVYPVCALSALCPVYALCALYPVYALCALYALFTHFLMHFARFTHVAHLTLCTVRIFSLTSTYFSLTSTFFPLTSTFLFSDSRSLTRSCVP